MPACIAENADEKTLRREQTRWKAADGDGDGRLSQLEFVALVHPELFAHMEKTLVEETLEDMDKNHNGRIERDEFLDDVLKQEGAFIRSSLPSVHSLRVLHTVLAPRVLFVLADDELHV